MLSITLTGCGNKTDESITTQDVIATTEEATETVDIIENTSTTVEEATETTEEVIDYILYENSYKDINIRTNLPEEATELVPEHLDQWHGYLKKILAMYDVTNILQNDELGKACLKHMGGRDYTDLSEFATKDLTGNTIGMELKDFGAAVLMKYADMYINDGVRDIDFHQLWDNMTVEEAEEILNAEGGNLYGIFHVYFGIKALDWNLPFDPTFNMIANMDQFKDLKDFKGRSWTASDADDTFIYGTHYLYSFYNEDPEGKEDLGLCWFFDDDGNLVDVRRLEVTITN